MDGIEGMDGIDGIDGIDGRLTLSSGVAFDPMQSPVQVQFQTVAELVAALAAGAPLPQSQVQFQTFGSPLGAPSAGGAPPAGAGLSPAAAPPVPITTFCWIAGPSSPGLRMRSEMLVFDWPLVELGGGTPASAGGTAGCSGGGAAGGSDAGVSPVVRDDGADTPPVAGACDAGAADTGAAVGVEAPGDTGVAGGVEAAGTGGVLSLGTTATPPLPMLAVMAAA
jgi:hypothetical protein